MRARGDALVGILNGIDTDLWDPATDPLLESNYDIDSIDGRAANRTALLDRLGWPVDDVPLAAVVTRLTDQKGIDLITPIVPLLREIPMRIAVLGSGDAVLADELRYLAATYPDTLAFVDGYDEALSHQLFAGGDVFLMPSRFEPCGLTQMQAMRYGAIPVVTAVGGLVDTVPDADRNQRRRRFRGRPGRVGGPARGDVPRRPACPRSPTSGGAAEADDEHRLVVGGTRRGLSRAVSGPPPDIGLISRCTLCCNVCRRPVRARHRAGGR